MEILILNTNRIKQTSIHLLPIQYSWSFYMIFLKNQLVQKVLNGFCVFKNLFLVLSVVFFFLFSGFQLKVICIYFPRSGNVFFRPFLSTLLNTTRKIGADSPVIELSREYKHIYCLIIIPFHFSFLFHCLFHHI